MQWCKAVERPLTVEDVGGYLSSLEGVVAFKRIVMCCDVQVAIGCLLSSFRNIKTRIPANSFVMESGWFN